MVYHFLLVFHWVLFSYALNDSMPNGNSDQSASTVKEILGKKISSGHGSAYQRLLIPVTHLWQENNNTKKLKLRKIFSWITNGLRWDRVAYDVRPRVCACVSSRYFDSLRKRRNTNWIWHALFCLFTKDTQLLSFFLIRFKYMHKVMQIRALYDWWLLSNW